MDWPEKYTSVERDRFENGPYSIVPIRYEDRHLIMDWRNEQVYHLRQRKPLNSDDQEYYFKNVVKALFTEEQPKQYLFSYMRNNECIGYGGLVHINWIDRNAEISFLLKTELEKSHFAENWGIFLEMIEKFAFKFLFLHKIYTYAYDLRPNLYGILVDSGYSLDARLRDHIKFDESYVDVLIHSKINHK